MEKHPLEQLVHDFNTGKFSIHQAWRLTIDYIVAKEREAHAAYVGKSSRDQDHGGPVVETGSRKDGA